MKPWRSHTDVEALEVRIEDAWIRIGCISAQARRTLWLTPNLCIFGLSRAGHEPPKGSVEFGTYTRDIELDEFRKDVFHVFDLLTRG